MWIWLAVISSVLLGFYDVAKKRSVSGNAVLPVLTIATSISALFFLPVIISSEWSLGWFEGSVFDVTPIGVSQHLLIALKACIVAATWLFGYLAVKHLPLTIVSPIYALRPVLVLLGSILIFGERLNLYQWIGVVVAFVAFYLMNRSSNKEGIRFRGNRGVGYLFMAVLLGVGSAFCDKILMKGIQPASVQAWCGLYIAILYGILTFIIWRPKRKEQQFSWRWSIVFISIFLSIADFCYFNALAQEGALLAVISLIRRGSVIVSFSLGALIFKERNIKSKALALCILLVGLYFLLHGSLV
ncbi:MAG: DMT family transporter [Tidjanibacter sp.]|nr:DMT family transporter [Tidjanibacter sp.]MBQ1964328.1 DMT family transporter [Tidjanibacter sp.]